MISALSKIGSGADILKEVLLPYQRDWVCDRQRFKIGLWARQTGKDFTCAAEAVFDCLLHPGVTWIVLASGERQALESLEKAKLWAEACDLCIAHFDEKRPARTALLQSAEIRFANGSRLMALPAKPETIRGYSANLILTEFAFHDRPAEIWRAIYPSISNPLRGGPKKIRIISTPNGIANTFHDLWGQKHYSRHRVTIHDAVSQGLPIDIAELKQGLNDEEGWRQEYECEFMDTTSVLLPYELIQSCEHPEASGTLGLGAARHPVYLGIDFGRKQDLTVCWAIERIGNELWTREVLVLNRISTPEQIELLRPRIQKATLACVDYTGAGIGLGDFLVREFAEFNWSTQSGGKIELCTFTSVFKAELFSKLRMQFESGTLRIPSDPAIREDLHLLHRVVNQAGEVSYRASRAGNGHSDRGSALALALRAASTHRAGCAYESITPSGRSGPWISRKW